MVVFDEVGERGIAVDLVCEQVDGFDEHRDKQWADDDANRTEGKEPAGETDEVQAAGKAGRAPGQSRPNGNIWQPGDQDESECAKQCRCDEVADSDVVERDRDDEHTRAMIGTNWRTAAAIASVSAAS